MEKVAIYCRLSEEDRNKKQETDDSNSIQNQKAMLLEYSIQQGWEVYNIYSDDNYTGSDRNRPEFKRLLDDAEAHKFDIVLCKSQSRFTRELELVEKYINGLFPIWGIRFISLVDNADTANKGNKKSRQINGLVNEWYLEDMSENIRAVLTNRRKNGFHIGAFALYGYQKDPVDKNHLVVDRQSGQVVKRIFRMAAEGAPPAEIARSLNERGIPPPAVYRCMTHDGLDVNAYSKRQEWTSATIAKMLRNVVYLGHIAQGKTTKVSFKSQLTVRNPREQWIVVENTHEALVDQETFDLARRRAMVRTCEKKGTFYNLFSGIAKCADCGRNMSTTGTRKKGSPANLTCGGYKLYGAEECSNHFIDYNVLYEIVQASLREQLAISREERAAVLENAQKKQPASAGRQERSKEISSIKKRLRELEGIIAKLYEDNAAGRLSNTRMKKLLSKYEQEAEALEQRMAALQSEKATWEPSLQETREKLDKLLRQITDVAELTPKLLFKLVDHIEIGQGHYEKGEHGKVKHQTVKIFYRFQTQAAVKEYRL